MPPHENAQIERRLVRTRRGYVHALSMGDGVHPIILLPILPTGTMVFEACLPLLADFGYTPIVIDLMGYGRSDKRDSLWTISDFADNIEEVLETISVAPTRLLGGHFSSLVAVEMARRPGSAVNSLVLDGPTLNSTEYAAKASARRLPPSTITTREFGAGQWDHVANMYRLLDPNFAVTAENERAFRRAFLAMGEADMPPSVLQGFLGFDLAAALVNVTARLLVIGGAHDSQRQFYQPTLDLMTDATGVFFPDVHPLHDLAKPERASEYVSVLTNFFGTPWSA